MALARRLHFVVGTSLLGASLSIGCTAKPPVNEKPVKDIREAPPVERVHVNEGPKPKPEPPPPEVITVNPGPEPIEEKRVNTRPSEI